MQVLTEINHLLSGREKWFAASRLQLAIVVTILGAVAACIVEFGGLSMPLMTPDSASYIHWAPQRTPGYPFFLSVVAILSHGYTLLPAIQYIVLIGAVVMLCDAFACLLRSYRATFFLAVAIFGNVFLMRYPTSVMTDSLFLSFLLAYVAVVLHVIRSPRTSLLITAGLLLGCAALVRPAGYAFLFALVWTVILWPSRRFMRSGLLFVAALTPLLAACLGNFVARGYFAVQLFGEGNMLMSMSILMPSRVPGLDPQSIARSYDALTPARTVIASMKGWDEKVLARYFSGTSAIDVEPAVKAVDADPQRWKTASPYWRDIAIEHASGKIVRTIILTRPFAFADKVIREYYGLWFLPVATTKPIFTSMTNAFSTHAAQLREALRGSVKIVPQWAYLLKFVGLGSVLLASLAVIVAVLFWPSAELRALAWLSLTLHTYFLFVAAVGIAVPRYMLVVWPLEAAILIGAITLLIQWRYRPVASTNAAAIKPLINEVRPPGSL
jgi:hypothetical protein